jgi:hypothetical protein
MVSAVFDTSVLVSAFFTCHQPRKVSNELLQFVAEGKIRGAAAHLPGFLRENSPCVAALLCERRPKLRVNQVHTVAFRVCPCGPGLYRGRLPVTSYRT